MQNEENNEFEKTKELDSFQDLNNQIVEIQEHEKDIAKEILDNDEANQFFTTPKKVKLSDKIKNWWKRLNKKQHILIIIGFVFLLILITIGIIFLVKNLNKKEEIVAPPEVIVQEENYRYENGVLILLNNNKEEIGRYTCENQNENLCFVSYYDTEDQFDVEQKEYENGEKIKTRSSIMLDQYVFINDNPRVEDSNIKLYDFKNQKLENSYQLVKKVDTNKMIVKNESGLYGVIEITSDAILTKVDFVYNNLGFIPNDKNYYVALQNEQNILINESGKNISKAINDSIKSFNATYITALNDVGKYVVYNYSNQKVFDDTYDFVKLYDDFAVLIDDTKMYLKFYDGSKLNEEAYNLSNRNYVKTSVYDANNVLKEVRESFSIEENNDLLTITLYNGVDNNFEIVNKAEGELNKKLRNMSYFNGKLYFYSDTAKETLLGSYTCANKNNVDSKTTYLKNCTLANDTNYEDNDYENPGKTGTIPIFNERFAFISDDPELVNENSTTVVLYDLKKNSSLGKYRSVNTYSYTGTEDITFSTITDLQVVAQNQSGNFGVIKVNLTDVTGHIAFNYSEMEKLNEYYVAKDAMGYALISRKDGTNLVSNISYKIRNYIKTESETYVKVIRNGEYYIYNSHNNAISEKGFKYVELYDNYFAGVNNNNELGIFTYAKPEQNILSGGALIQLYLTNYYGNGTLAFKITGDEILVGTSDKTYTPADQRIALPVEES